MKKSTKRLNNFIWVRPLIFVFLGMFVCGRCFARSPQISVLSSFTVNGQFDLKPEPDFACETSFRTLNHEGGLKVRVLELKEGQGGSWLYVLVRHGFWAESGQWIVPYSKFWVFLDDETEIFDFEE
ncbi:MAG: hypothetical protein PUE30_09575 [Spirochaetia bacterium]|nr:hypothetical protein [Spirochaetia bacterium]